MRAARARGNYANFWSPSSFFLILKKTSHTSFCFFETSKLVSPQFLLFTLFCFREKNGEKTLQLTSINFVYMRLPDLWRIARIAMALCTREAKFEAVQRHYTTLRLMFDILPQILALYDQHWRLTYRHTDTNIWKCFIDIVMKRIYLFNIVA